MSLLDVVVYACYTSRRTSHYFDSSRQIKICLSPALNIAKHSPCGP
ncbi:hypothetical protein HMPREF0201_02210 [Cedecea davisae DSM 4568]|uniref:Uncharacterized protein n=1 Tax=Cedecea davisae DSM 4568 TaxID=566551 RepID=S3IVI7_9ENTR|nr:hypothetical protein HMPREF0201_02210 [Cedecea davisae DSM 4568]